MTAPAGAVVRIYVDLAATVEPGHVIQTQTGRRYRVIDVRRQSRGKHAGRQHLQCMVLGDRLESRMTVREWMATTIHEIRWYRRGRG